MLGIAGDLIDRVPEHGTDNFGQELFHLLRGAAGEIFGAQLGLNLLAGQTECRVSFWLWCASWPQTTQMAASFSDSCAIAR